MDFIVQKPIRKVQLDQLAENIESLVGRKLFTEMIVEKPKSQTPHVLIVDDDDISRMYLRRQLEKNGFQCSEAKDGLEAVDVYKRESANIELIFMDSQMPRMNGLEATKMIRSQAMNTKLKIFGLTGMDSEEFKAAAMRAGMNDVCLKPIPFERLIQIVNNNIVSK